VNQTFNLQSGVGQPPLPRDLITKKTACAAAERGTPHPIWSEFLDRVTGGDVDLQMFLQRYIGYCCTGFTSEHVFVFAYGTGANGKSTFMNTIVGILGDYATVADMGTFIASGAERHPTDLAKLRGARLVVATETQKGRRWDEAKLKAITGGDKITARFMRQDFFDFVPTFKLFITGNHRPRISTVDEAMRRRLLLVPFTIQIPEAERDQELPKKLRAEWPAILRWAIEGCLEWQRVGLAPPQSVLQATRDYFASEDTFGQWLEDECNVEIGKTGKWDLTGRLFESWSVYATKGGDNPGSKIEFSRTLQEWGFEPSRKHGNRCFLGIRLKASDYRDGA
jgi:P4 family phage/plasmid primase-like protien